MTRSIDAVFENGCLRPLHALEGIGEHARVHLTVESVESTSGSLADCVGILPDADAEELRRIIEGEFEQVNLGEW